MTQTTLDLPKPSAFRRPAKNAWEALRNSVQYGSVFTPHPTAAAHAAKGWMGKPDRDRHDWEATLRSSVRQELATAPTSAELEAMTVSGCQCYACRANREAAKRWANHENRN